jgi:hypothetical protein
VAVPDETLDGAHLRLTKVVRGNLRVHLSDVVSLQKVEDVKTGKKVCGGAGVVGVGYGVWDGWERGWCVC